MLVAGEGRAPNKTHLLALAQETGIARGVANQIVDEVQEACRHWDDFAEQAGASQRQVTDFSGSVETPGSLNDKMLLESRHVSA